MRLLIGSTKKLGTGVNVQERVIAMHHLDIPWRPSDFEQRIGRGGRQGNRMAKDFRGKYSAELCVCRKPHTGCLPIQHPGQQTEIHQPDQNSSIDKRKIDEGALDQEGGMNFGEYVALLSGNTDLLEKVKQEKKLYDLERSYQVFLKRKSEASFYIDMNTRDLKQKESALVKLEADWKPIHSIDLEKAPLVIAGKSFDDKKEAGEQLHVTIEHLKQKGVATETEIARLLDFKLFTTPFNQRSMSAVRPG